MHPSELLIPGKIKPVKLNQPIDNSKYFTWGEALHGLTRTPEHAGITKNIIILAGILDGLREFLKEPIIVTSWYRDPAANKAAGGVANSEHLSGAACDFYVRSVDGPGLGNLIDSKVEGGLGVYPSWVHVDLGPYSRW